MENLNEKICELYNQELADLMIGYNFNTARLSEREIFSAFSNYLIKVIEQAVLTYGTLHFIISVSGKRKESDFPDI